MVKVMVGNKFGVMVWEVWENLSPDLQGEFEYLEQAVCSWEWGTGNWGVTGKRNFW